MTDYVWSEVRARAVALFDDLPHADTERAVLNVFQRAPTLVIAAVEHVGEQRALGKVRNGWAVLRAHLQRAESSSELVVSDESERDRRLTLAEGWVRNAGMHFDCEEEVLAELFGERGRLRAWASDDALRARLLGLWHEARPIGEQIELAVHERVEDYRRIRVLTDDTRRGR